MGVPRVYRLHTHLVGSSGFEAVDGYFHLCAVAVVGIECGCRYSLAVGGVERRYYIAAGAVCALLLYAHIVAQTVDGRLVVGGTVPAHGYVASHGVGKYLGGSRRGSVLKARQYQRTRVGASVVVEVGGLVLDIEAVPGFRVACCHLHAVHAAQQQTVATLEVIDIVCRIVTQSVVVEVGDDGQSGQLHRLPFGHVLSAAIGLEEFIVLHDEVGTAVVVDIGNHGCRHLLAVEHYHRGERHAALVAQYVG